MSVRHNWLLTSVASPSWVILSIMLGTKSYLKCHCYFQLMVTAFPYIPTVPHRSVDLPNNLWHVHINVLFRPKCIRCYELLTTLECIDLGGEVVDVIKAVQPLPGCTASSFSRAGVAFGQLACGQLACAPVTLTRCVQPSSPQTPICDAAYRNVWGERDSCTYWTVANLE